MREGELICVRERTNREKKRERERERKRKREAEKKIAINIRYPKSRRSLSAFSGPLRKAVFPKRRVTTVAGERHLISCNH